MNHITTTILIVLSSCVAGNFLYQALNRQDWAEATMRSWFQGTFALFLILTFYIVDRK